MSGLTMLLECLKTLQNFKLLQASIKSETELNIGPWLTEGAERTFASDKGYYANIVLRGDLEKDMGSEKDRLRKLLVLHSRTNSCEN